MITLENIKDISIIIASLTAACVGIKGLGTWRRQLKGNTEYNLAKNIMTAVYELREAISFVRHPLMEIPAEPNASAEKLKEMDDIQKRWLSTYQTYQKRWEPVRTIRAKLDANLLEAEVIWGKEFILKVQPLTQLVNKLFFSIQQFMEVENPNISNDQKLNDRDIIKELRKRIFYNGDDKDENDEYWTSFKTAINEIEKTLKPHIVEYHRK
jgi:hypothetical protein